MVNTPACVARAPRSAVRHTRKSHRRTGAAKTVRCESSALLGGGEPAAFRQAPSDEHERRERGERDHVQPPPRDVERHEDASVEDRRESRSECGQHREPPEPEATLLSRELLGNHRPRDRSLHRKEEVREELQADEHADVRGNRGRCGEQRETDDRNRQHPSPSLGIRPPAEPDRRDRAHERQREPQGRIGLRQAERLTDLRKCGGDDERVVALEEVRDAEDDEEEPLVSGETWLLGRRVRAHGLGSLGT
jgi:hypothetical protein